MQQLFENLLSLGRRRLAIMGAVATVIIVTVVVAFTMLATPDRAPLYKNLSVGSANAIQVALASAGFDAQLSADQTEILVPRPDHARARMVVAEMGMPIDGEPGWEIFDNRNALAMNSFMQRVNRLRAMEGELGRSIQTLDDVHSARVHLVLPEREPFARNKPEPRASVIVRAGIGRTIERNQAVAIRALVASAVPNLKVENVTVLSAKGETILGDGGRAAGGDEPIQAARTAIEDRFARQVEDILSARVGAGNARVRVNVDLTTAREVVVEEIFDPDQQIVRSTESTSERRDELDSSGNVGVENNIPAALQDGAAADNGRSSQENVGETVEYEIGSTRREIVREAGEIERVSVAVLVNGIYGVENGEVRFTDRSPEELAQLSELVRTAVGFDERRGDTVSVASLRFMDYSMEMGEPITLSLQDRIGESIVPIVRSIIALILVLLVFLVFVRPLLRRLETSTGEADTLALDAPQSAADGTPLSDSVGSTDPKEPQQPASPGIVKTPEQASNSAITTQMPGVASVYDPNVELGPNDYLETLGIRGRLTKARVDAIRHAADEQPEDVLRVLRGWLSGEAEA